ncbi:MAG: HAD family hydrolase [Muribaculaceae bacterium]|nr:HAD family hydrolase [Muribaculaceae bacterium]
MKELIIFDLDGTLINSIADLGSATNYALRTHGLAEHTIESYHYMVGNGIRKLMERAAPEADQQQIDILLESFREYYDEHCMDHTTPYPGMPELLAELSAKGIKIAVASNKYQSAAERIVRHYFPDIEFAVIRGEQAGCPKKPDPSVIFAILGECPTAKSKVLMVGDSAVDIETARRACIESVGVTWGFRPVSELSAAYADHIISEPSEVLGISLEDK